MQEDITLTEFESHRRNRQSKKGIISNVKPLNKDTVKIKYELHYGEEFYSENLSSKEIAQLLEHLGFDRNSSIRELENKDITLKYLNNEWKIDKNWSQSSQNDAKKYTKKT